MNSNALMCWFCGNSCSETRIEVGHCIGTMIFSSISSAVFCETNETERDGVNTSQIIERLLLHQVNDSPSICVNCIQERVESIDSLTSNEIQMRRIQQENAATEGDWYDYGSLDWPERSHLFYCWFELYPNKGNGKWFQSIPVGKLCDLGFRFTGTCSAEGRPLDSFLDRFESESNRYSDGVYEHLTNHFTFPSLQEIERFSNVRAVISDLAICEYSGRI